MSDWLILVRNQRGKIMAITECGEFFIFRFSTEEGANTFVKNSPFCQANETLVVEFP